MGKLSEEALSGCTFDNEIVQFLSEFIYPHLRLKNKEHLALQRPGKLWEKGKWGNFVCVLLSDVVFAMSVGFGGQLIGYVTSGRALICFLPPALAAAQVLLLAPPP